jgi:hypothetical protein
MSKFGNLKQIREQLNTESSATRNAEMSDTHQFSTPATQPVTPTTKRLGRPPAKRSDPAYTQVSGYVRRATLTATKRKLLDEGDREFSDLLEELLTRWVRQG